VEAHDIVIVGGGPAGSTCAWRLRQAGLDVVVMDQATFQRDKVCAGWVTPQVFDDLRIDPDEYGKGRTCQPITGFRVGVIGVDDVVETSYDRTVSFGIRRSEFDDFFLRRSAARLLLGTPVSTIRRDGAGWIVNERVSAPMLVGAGGHFCPVARMLNGASRAAPLVVAQEVAVAIDHRACPIDAERPELYFCPDLEGYGWCFRKGDYVNIGLGRRDPHGLPRATGQFLEFLKTRRGIHIGASWRWRGHAYLVSASRRRAVDEAVIVAGDAAGLAYPESGEGIRPAIVSGLLAASTIVEANGRYSYDRLRPYTRRLQQRFGEGPFSQLLAHVLPRTVTTVLVLRLLDTSWFVRHVVLDRWFLHAGEAVLAAA
jgi:flavin-dependent dehydrogenase